MFASKSMVQKFSRWFVLICIAALMTTNIISVFATPLLGSAGTTTLVSVASDGTQGNYDSLLDGISSDGRYLVFYSVANNLVIDDTNDSGDIFVHDRQTGETRRVSVATGGAQANDSSYISAISDNGQFVAFNSLADNLDGPDTNDERDIFLHNLLTGQTSRVSVGYDGSDPDDYSYDPALSADGRFVVFVSYASNLVIEDTNDLRDIFLYDGQTDQIELVSITTDGDQADGSSGGPSVSADGRYVVFHSFASNLVAGDDNSQADIFIRDRVNGQTICASLAADDTPGDGNSTYPSISDDGRYLVYSSTSSDLISGDLGGFQDIFIYDMQTSEISRVSVNSLGEGSDDLSEDSSISPDGRYVTFSSPANNLDPACEETPRIEDIFYHDRQTGTTICISLSTNDQNGNARSEKSFISQNGRIAVFDSQATNLVDGDTNDYIDVFARVIYDEYLVFVPLLQR